MTELPTPAPTPGLPTPGLHSPGLPSGGLLGPVRARELLDDIAVYQQHARRPPALWPPLVIFGLVAATDAPISIYGSLAASLWWVITAPAGFAVVGSLMARHGHRRGVESRPWVLPALGLGSFLLAFAGLWLFGELHVPATLGWVLLVAAGYLAWSRFARSLPAAVVAVCLAAVGIVLTLSPLPGWTVELGVGVTMIIGGLLLRRGPEAPSVRNAAPGGAA